MLSFLRFLFISAVIILLVGAFVVLDKFKRNDLIIPRIVMADVSLSGMSRSSAGAFLKGRIEKFLSDSNQIAARGKVSSIILKDIDISINELKLMDDLPFAGDLSNAEVIYLSFFGVRIEPKALISSAELARVIEEKFPEIPRAQNAKFVLKNGKMAVEPERTGVAPKLDSLVNQLKTNIAFLQNSPLFIEFQESQPTVLTLDLEQNKNEILSKFPKKYRLFLKNKNGK